MKIEDFKALTKFEQSVILSLDKIVALLASIAKEIDE